MRLAHAVCLLPLCLSAAELKSGPALPHKLVRDWAQLPKGWNLGECSGVAVDPRDNVWVFNRGPHPVIQFDKKGKILQSWGEGTVEFAHGIRVGPDGNIWGVDVKGHAVLKYSPAGRLLKILGARQGMPGNNDSRDAFNEPTNLVFGPSGDFFISDGYVNSRVIHFSKDAEYIGHWGRKGTGDGEFDLVHDIVRDKRGRLYVADRTNERVQIFDEGGRFLGKWTDVGAPWGLDYIEREDAIYMCDGLNNRVIKLNLGGQVLGVLGAYGKDPGKFDLAHSIAVDSEGSIYVAEIRNLRVQKFAR